MGGDTHIYLISVMRRKTMDFNWEGYGRYEAVGVQQLHMNTRK